METWLEETLDRISDGLTRAYGTGVEAVVPACTGEMTARVVKET